MADNNSKSFEAIILAAGKSSRFNTGRTKLLEKICGRPMVLYPTALLSKMNIPITMVVGFQKDAIEKSITASINTPIKFIEQKEQKGTGHAIACTQQNWSADNILILNGDMPLLTADIVKKIIKKHTESDATISFATAHHCDPEAGYGRVIKADDNIQIIEAQDFEGDITEQCCVNAGIYIIKRAFLKNAITELTNNNVQKEWYITDLINIASKQKLKIETLSVPFDRIRGVNDFKELWAAEQIKKSEIIEQWMKQGVRFSIAHNVQIDWDVTIGSGSTIGSGVKLLNGTTIGKNCTIGSYSYLNHANIQDSTTVHLHTIIDDSQVGSHANVGPFSFVHGNSTIQNNATVGSFVEVNRSEIGAYSKAKHLSYLGDTTIGEQAIIGAGLITCNYDSANKHKTQIGDNAFIGGNNTLVAPVTVENNAMTAAGSTITDNVEQNDLAIARQRQVNKKGYAKQIKEKAKTFKNEKKSCEALCAQTTLNTKVKQYQ